MSKADGSGSKMRKRGVTEDPVKLKAEFIENLSRGWTVTAAAKATKISRRGVYFWRDEDPDFAAAWDDAIAAGNEMLEQEAYRRAVEGNMRPVFIKGEMVGEVREYSDHLLMFLLRGRKPETFGNRVDLTSKGESLASHFARALLAEDADHGGDSTPSHSAAKH